MKKLMFGLVAAAACSAMAIESANIVGYQNAGVRQYLSVQLPTFDGVAVSGIDIQSIKPIPAEGEDLESGDFVIQFYSNTGAIESSYMYCLGEEIDMEQDGWYEEDMETLVEKVFASGEGFNVQAAKGGSLTFPALSL